ncbi:MAG: hypothetical protein FD119_96 [Stygiobacter sp.]|nr:MAG: hypothetical protein FD119_96 [Stygiobacter sp.]
MGPQIRAVATEDGRHVHDGVLLCLGASGSAREVLGALIDEFGGLLEAGPGQPWTEAEGRRLTATDAQETMACTIAETMGWENLPTAIRMAESLTIDAGMRRRFTEALARTGYPFAPGG